MLYIVFVRYSPSANDMELSGAVVSASDWGASSVGLTPSRGLVLN